MAEAYEYIFEHFEDVTLEEIFALLEKAEREEKNHA